MGDIDGQPLQDGGVSEAQPPAAVETRRQGAGLGQLHGAGDRSAEADRVQTQLVAAVIGRRDGRQVVDVADRPHQDDGFVLRTLSGFVRRSRPDDPGAALTADGTEMAAGGSLQNGPGDGFARDPLQVLVPVSAILEIAAGQHPDDVDELDQAGRPEFAQEPLGHRGLPQEMERLIISRLVALGIPDPDFFLSGDADRLQVF